MPVQCPRSGAACGVDVDVPRTGQAAEGSEPVLSPRRLEREERERILHGAARHDARSRLVRKGIVVAALAGIAWLAHWRVTAYLAEHRVRELLLAAARGKDVEGAAQELSGTLPLVVSHCNAFLSGDPALEERSAIETGLRAVLPRMPRDVDLAPLLDLTPKAGGAYRSAVRLVRGRAEREWLIARTCRGSGPARAFAVEALRPFFPFGRLTDDEAATLAGRTSLDAKRKLFDEVYDAVHRRLEAQWAGRYRLRIDASWRNPGRPATAHQITTSAAPIHVTCQHRTWRVTMAGAEWSGAIDDLPELSLTCRAQPLFGLRMLAAPLRALWSSRVTLTFDQEGFAAGFHSVPRHSPTTRGSTPLDRKHRIPRGALIVGTTIRTRGNFPVAAVSWVLPPQPGFERFDVSLVRTP